LALLLKQSNVAVLHNFLVKRSIQVMQRFFGNISYDLWNGIAEDDDEEMMKEKVINFLNPFHVVKNIKEIFLTFK